MSVFPDHIHDTINIYAISLFVIINSFHAKDIIYILVIL